jgi:hypothetical protein
MTSDQINAAVQKQDWRSLCDYLNSTNGSDRPCLQTCDDEHQTRGAILDEFLYRNMWEAVGELLQLGVNDEQFSSVISHAGKGTFRGQQADAHNVIVEDIVWDPFPKPQGRRDVCFLR